MDKGRVVSTETEEPPICKLNEDCLRRVNRYLCFIDQYSLSRLCSSFENVFKYEFQRKFKDVVIKDGSERTLARIELLSDYGHLVETVKMKFFKLQIDHNFDDDLFKELVSVFCSNLKLLEVNRSGPFPPHFFANIQHFKNLHTIKITSCALEDGELQCLSRISSVEVLEVVCTIIYDDGFPSDCFENLKQLSIEECRIQPTAFVSMCEALSKLTALNIKFCENISDDEIKQMCSLCPNLRELTICNSFGKNIEPVVQLPKLEKLHLNIAKDFTDELFIEIADKLKNQLRVLTIDHEYRSHMFHFMHLVFTEKQMKCICEVVALEELYFLTACLKDDFLSSLMQSLPNLKILDAYGCTNLTSDAILEFIRNAPNLQKFTLPTKWNYNQFIVSVIDILKERRFNQDKPFILEIKDVAYQIFSEESREYIRSHSDIINVIEIPFDFNNTDARNMFSYMHWDNVRWIRCVGGKVERLN